MYDCEKKKETVKGSQYPWKQTLFNWQTFNTTRIRPVTRAQILKLILNGVEYIRPASMQNYKIIKPAREAGPSTKIAITKQKIDFWPQISKFWGQKSTFSPLAANWSLTDQCFQHEKVENSLFCSAFFSLASTQHLTCKSFKSCMSIPILLILSSQVQLPKP